MLDDTAPVYEDLQPYQYHGSVYGVIPGEARRAEAGGRVELRGDLDQGVAHHGDGERRRHRGRRPGRGVAATARSTSKDHPGLKRASGYIGFLSHDSVVRFRNIRIKDLR